jgi:biotin carboxyl carrier protein
MNMRIRCAGVAVATAAVLTATPAPAAAASPTFQAPFLCNQTWTAGTFVDHNPRNAVDWNFYPKSQEVGKAIVASQAGTVIRSEYATTTGYGHFVEVNHGGGWHTLYAHLASRSVRVGDRVKSGQQLGIVGHTSAKADIATHLHYEQRLNGRAVQAVIAGDPVTYYGHERYTSTNACHRGAVSGVVDTDSVALSVRQGPGREFPVVRQLANGSTVTISCQTVGDEDITGTRGTSRLWNRIGDRQYISDAYVDTGTMSRVAPTC